MRHDGQYRKGETEILVWGEIANSRIKGQQKVLAKFAGSNFQGSYYVFLTVRS